MHKILITGAGKIGALIACLLLESKDFDVTVADLEFSGTDIKRVKNIFPHIKTISLNVEDKKAFSEIVAKYDISSVISCLPFFANHYVAENAAELNLNYFDITEDINAPKIIKGLAEKATRAFVPRCGLAPGFVGIVATDLMKEFEKIDEVKLRVGALPRFSSNALHYALTWSTEGLINEYINECMAIKNGKYEILQPLQDLEIIELEGESYEAFNTSGGLGGLADLCLDKVNNLDYKTIRYPGHCEKMHFLLHDLKLANKRDLLKSILEHALPKTEQDIVLIYISVNGKKNGEYLEKNYIAKILPHTIAGLNWSAIQVTTAAEVCAVVDLVLQNPGNYKGFIWQESFLLQDILQNRFGKYFNNA